MKNNQKGFSTVEGLLVCVIVVLVGFTGWYIYNANKKTNATYNSASAISSNSNPKYSKIKNGPSTQPTTNLYAGWKTYASKAAGYTVQYPSSWTIEGFNGSGSAVPATQLNGSENSVLLFYPNSKTNSLGIWISNDTKYETSASAGGSGWGPLSYSAGTIIKTLSNGMNIWEQTEQNATSQQITSNAGASPGQTPVPDFEAVTVGQFGNKLSNGNYLQIEMGFQYARGQKTTLSYAQQSNSSELKQAESILASLKQN